jgi:hypothetical protein
MRRARTVLIAGLGAAAPALPALAQSAAHFDSVPEGPLGTVYTEGGLTFRDLDMRLDGSPPPNPFVAEDASANLSGAGYSSPNCLGFGGYSPGPGASFSRVGQFRIVPSAPGTSASLEVFNFDFGAGNSMSLAAYLAGQQVAIMTVPVPTGSIQHTHLQVSASSFDELRFFGSGPNDQGVLFALVDEVIVNTGTPDCYANCDASTSPPILNVADFTCFLQKFSLGNNYANCDGSTTAPVLNVADFTCFLQKFAQGCS